MGLWSRLKSFFFDNGIEGPRENVELGSSFQMIYQTTTGFYAWDKKLYSSDIIRAVIRPKVKAVGKMVGKHLREQEWIDKETGETKRDLQVNPEPYMRYLLEEPNALMTGQVFLEKLATQLCLNNNAFALIVRGIGGIPIALEPLPCSNVRAMYNQQGELFLEFILDSGKRGTYPYGDLIHLRQDLNHGSIFGESPMGALEPLMEVVGTIDQGIIGAIKNSGFIRWLLKSATSQRPEDLKEVSKQFSENYMNTTKGVGVAAVDPKTEAVQIKPHDFVPNAAQMDRTTQRIYSFFNTNDKIVQSKYSEDDWIAYYESEVEPVGVQLSGEFTRKLFTRRERSHGNKIYFESSNLQFASMRTKLSLVSMVDRAALSPNEWRRVFGLAPTPGGDRMQRRLDTAPIEAVEEEDLEKEVTKDEQGNTD